jgi:AhpD family alkylhydroperoxidase
MMIDWNEYHNQVKEGTAKIGRISPDILRGYRMMGDAAKKSDLLGPKVRELIALAVAVTVQCDGCIVVHTEAALKNGATEEEIIEALGVTVQVKAGSALIFSTRVLDAVKAKSELPPDRYRINRFFSTSIAKFQK